MAMMLFNRWIGRPTPEKPRKKDAAEVAEILLIMAGDKREIRGVYQVGQAFFAWAFNIEDSAKRILPHGRVGSDGPSYVVGWEPVSPIDWQPGAAMTSHEFIASLEAELAATHRKLKSEAALHQEQLRTEKARFGMLAAAVREAEKLR